MLKNTFFSLFCTFFEKVEIPTQKGHKNIEKSLEKELGIFTQKSTFFGHFWKKFESLFSEKWPIFDTF